MKLVVTFANYGAAANVGGDVERSSEIIKIPDSLVPPKLKQHIEEPAIRKWQTVSFSILEEK